MGGGTTALDRSVTPDMPRSEIETRSSVQEQFQRDIVMFIYATYIHVGSSVKALV